MDLSEIRIINGCVCSLYEEKHFNSFSRLRVEIQPRLVDIGKVFYPYIMEASWYSWVPTKKIWVEIEKYTQEGKIKHNPVTKRDMFDPPYALNIPKENLSLRELGRLLKAKHEKLERPLSGENLEDLKTDSDTILEEVF